VIFAAMPTRSLEFPAVGRKRLAPETSAIQRGWPRREHSVVTVGILATLTAKPGKEQELASFLESALPLAEQEQDTTAWFAIKIDDATYGIFDVFPGQEGRQAHLDGPIAAALMAKAGELLSAPPDIRPIDVLAAKLPH
jgi:quinol monooxygenase YgiN